MIKIQSYLERINYSGPLSAAPETLRRLQLAHLLAVPFENLSIHATEPIVLNDDALFEIIVDERRGGFCYELNGLFAALLRGLGFEVTMLSAQVANASGTFGPDFEHMCLLVTLNDRWLVDVGFGDSFIEPLIIDSHQAQIQRGWAYRLNEQESYCVLMQRKTEDDDWRPQYRFQLKPYQYSDFAGMCHYHQTSADSHFTQKSICSRLTPDGRVTLADMRLIVQRDGGRYERPVESSREYAQLLNEHFGICL